ncbi:S41 family peptidase [Clostridium perfringens]|uniref:S41 family peptidase n=1 Tax=Clostridium perfringens TaxID=1502 RepID=UPI0022DF4B7A|nr:S41 family peptidase [Clostridium perfringens]MDK0540853.1 S41 family peptidase [Clostridium perfringens]MDK0670776.1 S41 family peptidase [Clostridium perfringens]MDK0957681.1 S41 family peptidase [Clostridium perfringens]MDM0500009.1 S41 family peptidase [Clostridium perfringens]MDM0501249.1 S41 family peptidase [Clostridium perfringens]
MLFILISTFVACGNKVDIGTPLTEEQKIEDFNYLYKTIEENYPFLETNKRLNNVDWLSKKEEYLQRVKNTKSDIEFLITLNSILSELNNGHTHMITNSSQFRDLREIYSMNKGWQKKVQLPVLNNKKALARYNINKNEKIQVLNQEKNENMEGIKNASTKDIVKGKIGYIYIPQMISYYNMGKDIELIDEYLNNIKKYQALIIDIRGNGGGDSYYWISYLVPKLIDKVYENTTYSFWKDGEVINNYLKKSKVKYSTGFGEMKDLDTTKLVNLPVEVKEDFKYYSKNTMEISPSEDSIKFKGNIYMLVDKGVYSSSEAFASFAKQTGFATLIGERTGGDGIGSDPLLHMLPNSGYIFRFSKDMGTTADGTSNEEFKTEPDYEIQYAGKTGNFENDYCIKKVLELE